MYQRTRIEKAVQEVSEIESSVEYLVNEFKSILEANIPFEKKGDLIGKALLSIDNKIDLVNDEINNLKEYKLKLKQAKSIASIVGAEVFNSYGISKLEGIELSSITTISAVESVKHDLFNANEDVLIEQGFYKKVLDKSKVLKAYKEGEYIDFINANAKVVEIKTTIPPKLRINKRRANNITNFTNLQGDAA